MAYYSGTANDFIDLKASIEAACVSEGWALTDGILSREGAYHQLTASGTAYLQLNGGNGQSGTTLTDTGTRGARLVNLNDNPMPFPIGYEIHIFDDAELEVYCIVNFNADFYQMLAFGQSRVPGVGGSGNWYSGNLGEGAGQTNNAYMLINMNTSSIGAPNSPGLTMGLFGAAPLSYAFSRGDFIHIGLDGWGWWENTPSQTRNMSWAAGLLTSLPNASNQATVLIPAKCVVYRPDSGQTIIWSPPNVRWTRNDNLAPGATVQYGADQWRVYPAYRKDATERDGTGSSTARHSGTLAYAIRYTGP